MPRGKQRYWTLERMVAAVQEEARLLGHTPDALELAAAHKAGRNVPWATTVHVNFGSLVALHVAAGLVPAIERRHKPTRLSLCKKQLHMMTSDNVREYACANGFIHRRCRACQRATNAAIRQRERVRRSQYPRARNAGWFKPKARIVRFDVARRHSPGALARYWGATA